MAFAVRLAPRAVGDAERIYRRVVQAAPLAGQRWYNRLIESLHSLAELPERCEVVERLTTTNRTVRKLLFGRKPHTYRIYFDIVENTVWILHIRHGARREAREKELYR